MFTSRATPSHRLRPVCAALFTLAALAIAACGSGGGGGGSDKLAVVATTTQTGDFVRVVGGDRVTLTQLLRPNSDPHDYEPRPSDVRAVTGAKIVFVSGRGLDSWAGDVTAKAGGQAQDVDLGAAAPVSRAGDADEGERVDPHWWHDPRNARAAVERVRDALTEADPDGTDTYRRNAAAYLAKLDALDRGIMACVGSVPRDRRKLVTDHDAFGYLADRYGIQVIGAVIPSQTTQAQPSAGDTARLADLIDHEHVRAIFPESSLNPKLAKALADQTGVTSDYTLYGDTLGPKGSSGATYLSMERANADAMVRGFTNGAKGCQIAGIR